MKKYFIYLFFIVMGAAVFLLISFYPKNKPLIYQGRTIDYWFTKLPPTRNREGGFVFIRETVSTMGQQYGSIRPETNLAFAAFESFGNDAIPYLMNKFLGSDSAIEQTARRLAQKRRINWFPARMADIERTQATIALIQLANLESLPDETVNILTKLSKDPNSVYAGDAKHILNVNKGFEHNR